MSDVDDGTLVRRTVDGDDDAFEVLVERYQTRIFNAVLRIVHDYDDARDVTQTVFVKAFEKLEGFDRRYKFFSWIYRIAMNESLNYCAKKSHREEFSNEAATDEPVANTDVHREVASTRDLNDALQRLKIEYRTVVVLKHLLGCSYREISVILEIPVKTVKSRLFTARELLREMLLGSKSGAAESR